MAQSRSKLIRGNLKPLVPQPGQQLFNMSAISCLDHAIHFHGVDIVSRERSIMRHIDNARTFARNNTSEGGQPTGPIADYSRKTAEPAIRSEPAFNDSSEDGRIDVSTGKQEDDFFTAQLRQKTGQA